MEFMFLVPAVTQFFNTLNTAVYYSGVHSVEESTDIHFKDAALEFI